MRNCIAQTLLEQEEIIKTQAQLIKELATNVLNRDAVEAEEQIIEKAKKSIEAAERRSGL